MKKLILILLLVFMVSLSSHAADMGLMCKDGSRPADEFQYRQAATLGGNDSCAWQRWNENPQRSLTEVWRCNGKTINQCGEYIGNKAIVWVDKNFPQESVWIREDVARWNFGAVEPAPEPEKPPFGVWNPTPDPTPTPNPTPAGDCSTCQEAVSTCNDKITRIQGILNE